MLDILVYEEKQQGVEEMGACLEYLLQHKLLETLCTLGKAQYPPGMSQQVLLFFSKLLSQMQQPLLHLVNVYKPVQKLIRLCALPGSQTEKEEAQFLLVICSRVKQDPHTLRYILEIADQPAARTSASNQPQLCTQASNHRTETLLPSSQSEPPASSPVQSEPPASSPVQSEPPASSPVQSEPPASSPVQSEPPASSHVQSEPPASSPVQSEPPASSPVQSEPPASSPVQSEPPASSPVQSEPPASSPVQSEPPASSPVQSEPPASSSVQSESTLLSALLQLTKSQRGSVCVKAYDSLLLLSGLQSGSSGEILSDQTQLAELLAGRLLELYSLLPVESLDPGQVQSWPHTPWSSDLRSEPRASDHTTNFFSWFDFLDHLAREAPQVLTAKVSQCVRRLWLVDVVQPQLLHTSEQVVLVSTSVLCAVVRVVQSSSLLDQLVHFLLRTQSVTHLLLQRCDHISDQISMVSLSLVDELLQKPHRDILDVLVLSSLQSRSYLSPPATGVDDRHAETSEDGEDLEEDPFFSDSLFSDTQLPPPPPPLSSGLGSTSAVVNSFLCLVPVEVRSAQLLQEGGYESYVHDAHTLVTECQTLSVSWDWPITLPAPASFSGEGEEFFEGHLLKVLFDRLGRILEQPYELNLQLTAVLSRLSSFSHPLLHEYLLNPYIHLSHCSRSLFSVLVRVMAELMQRIQQVSNLTDRLLNARRHLLGLSHNVELEHLTLLRGVIVLEEFCKELAAIAFIKMPLDQN
ncbi:protein FAM160B2 isoform X2 [Anabas testudineus]|nr:protein FAM160B2 isoform X2 [Anabas testudineus]